MGTWKRVFRLVWWDVVHIQDVLVGARRSVQRLSVIASVWLELNRKRLNEFKQTNSWVVDAA